MDYIAVEVTLDPFSEDLSNILTAELGDLGFETFETREPLLIAYIEAAQFHEPHVKVVLEGYRHLAQLSYTTRFIAETNWNAQWELQFQPVVIPVGKGCSIRSCRRGSLIPVLPVVTYRLVLDPDMSFGTGHHPTTYLMIASLLELESQVRGGQVLDFGCGTGLLAILSAKMGAVLPVHAIDNNLRAVAATRDNARRNRVPHKVHVKHGDGGSIQARRYDIILANIHRNILIEEMDTFARGLRPNGRLLLSGFFEADAHAVAQAALACGFKEMARKVKDGWVMLDFLYLCGA